MEFLNLVAIISSLSGMNIKDLMKIRKKQEIHNVTVKSLIRLFSIFEGDDKLVGYWNVAKWTYLDYHVYGALSILFKYPNEEKWFGILTLTYNRRKSKNLIHNSILHFIDRLNGSFFQGIYKVELKAKDGHYIGSTSMIYRNPEINKRFNGEFKQLQFDKSNDLIGEHFNDPNNKAFVKFNQRKRWKEINEIREYL